MIFFFLIHMEDRLVVKLLTFHSVEFQVFIHLPALSACGQKPQMLTETGEPALWYLLPGSSLLIIGKQFKPKSDTDLWATASGMDVDLQPSSAKKCSCPWQTWHTANTIVKSVVWVTLCLGALAPFVPYKTNTSRKKCYIHPSERNQTPESTSLNPVMTNADLSWQMTVGMCSPVPRANIHMNAWISIIRSIFSWSSADKRHSPTFSTLE